MGDRRLNQNELDIAMAMAIVCNEEGWETLNDPVDACCKGCGEEFGGDIPTYCPGCGKALTSSYIETEEGFTMDYDTAIILLDALHAAMAVIYTRGDIEYPPGKLYESNEEYRR